MPKELFSVLTLSITIFFATLILTAEDQKLTYAQTDVTPPSTTYIQTPPAPDGNNDWYVSTVQFDLTATDLESGVKEINYRIDEGTWQTELFAGTGNLAPNPSFETAGGTSSGIQSWEATITDPEGTYSQDTTEYTPGYATASAKIVTTGGSWHGINNKNTYVTATPFDNMSASVWFKGVGLTGNASFKVIAILDDDSEVEIDESGSITGTQDWTNISLDFTNPEYTKGVYLDIGLTGPGTLYADAVSITSSLVDTSTTITIGSDSANHKLEFYAVDNANNAETYSCTAPIKNCITFKIDQTPPGNWHDSGAYRDVFSADHELFVYTNVEDATSGLSPNTDQYQYKVDSQTTFGRYPDVLQCNGTWQTDDWVDLSSPPPNPGDNSAYLLTQKTDFCNSNWKICKITKFFAEDMAGNTATKDFCINGPWVSFAGEGTVRANYNIDMLAEANGDNTDGLIEAGGNLIDFFTSAKNWGVKNSPIPQIYNYEEFWDITDAKTTLSSDLVANTGVYHIDGDFEIEPSSLPGNYDNATFNQIVFVDGILHISTDVELAAASTALFIVSGDVQIDKNVDLVGIGIFADGDFYTAHDIQPNQATGILELKGVYSANDFVFKRTLQGTNNEDFAAESFTFEPKYIVQLKNLFDGSSVLWRYDQ